MADFDLSNMVIKNVISVTTMYSPDGAGSKRSNRQRWAVMLKYELQCRWRDAVCVFRSLRCGGA